jgi:aspartokinase
MKYCTIYWIHPWTGILNMLNHDLKMIQKDYVKFSLQSKLRAYIHDIMRQRNVYHSNKSVSLSQHIRILHHIVYYELNTCIWLSAKKLNMLSNNHIRSICYSSTNELMSCLMKWYSSSSSLCQACKFIHLQLQDWRLCFLL